MIKHWKSIIIFLIIVVISIVCFYQVDKYKKKQEDLKKVDFVVNIDFSENLIFSKYGVDVYVGDERKYLSHGQSDKLSFRVYKGENHISFVNASNSNIKKDFVVNIDGNIDCKYKINCYHSEIVVEEIYFDSDRKIEDNEAKIYDENKNLVDTNYRETIEKLKKYGFKNIVECPDYNLDMSFQSDQNEKISNLTINNSNDYKKGDRFNNDVEVKVFYKMDLSKDPNLIKLPSFEKEPSEYSKDDLVKLFKDSGFINVKIGENPLMNGDENLNDKFHCIKIRNNIVDVKNPNLKFYKDETILLLYNKCYKIEPKIDLLKTDMDTIYARRAVVTSMTNYVALDVLKPDNYTYDENKFHKYSEGNKNYLEVTVEGEWKKINEKNWHVDSMKLRDCQPYSSRGLLVSCDITFDGSNYILRNVEIASGKYYDLDSRNSNSVYCEELQPHKNHPYLTVPKKLILEKRPNDVLPQNN